MFFFNLVNFSDIFKKHFVETKSEQRNTISTQHEKQLSTQNVKIYANF